MASVTGQDTSTEQGCRFLTCRCIAADVDEAADDFGHPTAGIAQQFTMLKAPASADDQVQFSSQRALFDQPELQHGASHHPRQVLSLRVSLLWQDPEAEGKLSLRAGARSYLAGSLGESNQEKAAGTPAKDRAEAAKQLDAVAKLSKEKVDLLRKAALAHYGPKVASKPAEPTNDNSSQQKPNTKAAKGSADERALGEATAAEKVDINGNNKNTLPHTHWENIAHKKKTGMSNTGKRGSHHAVDGGKAHYGTCTHAKPNRQGRTVTRAGTTTSHPVNWWYVDLGSKRVIKEVHVTNTQGEEHKK